MAKFRKKKPDEIEAITFEELVQYGRDNGGNIVNGMPWSFEYKGHPITHENDECYLIITFDGIMHFTPHDRLVIKGNGYEIYPCKIDDFEKKYELAQESKGTGKKMHTVHVEGLYKHYKNGKRYEVIEAGTHTETGEHLVVYHALEDVGHYGSRKVWIRPKAMFEEGVELEDGTVVPRFQYIQ